MTFQTEFPDYPAADMPLIPAGFEDSSWHNNSAPSFENRALGLSVWIDYADPANREHQGERFIVHEIESDGAFKDDDAILETDDWQEVLALVATKANDWYEKTVGYRPQVDDATMTNDELFALVTSYLEAVKTES